MTMDSDLKKILKEINSVIDGLHDAAKLVVGADHAQIVQLDRLDRGMWLPNLDMASDAYGFSATFVFVWNTAVSCEIMFPMNQSGSLLQCTSFWCLWHQVMSKLPPDTRAKLPKVQFSFLANLFIS